MKPLGRRAFDLERHTLWQRRGVSALVVFASKRTPREHISSVRLQSAARAAADALGPNVSFWQVDCDHYGDVCTAFDEPKHSHRPYVGWFRGGALRGHFDGAHTSDAFLAWAASDVCHRSGSAHTCDPKSAAADRVRTPQPEFSSKNRAVALLAVWILCVLALTLLCEPG